MAGGAALSILLGICLRCCLSKEKAAGGGAGEKGSAGGESAGAGKREPTYKSNPFLKHITDNYKTTFEAYRKASEDTKYQGRPVPRSLRDPADLFSGDTKVTKKVFAGFFQ